MHYQYSRTSTPAELFPCSQAMYHRMILRQNVCSRSSLLCFFSLLLLCKFLLLLLFHFLLSVFPRALFSLRNLLFCLALFGSRFLLLDGLRPLPDPNTPFLANALFGVASRCVIDTLKLWLGVRSIGFEDGDSPGELASWL